MSREKRIIICSLFLGLGLGMIITSVFNFLYPVVTYREYSDEEIKSIARELGMIEMEEYYQLVSTIEEDKEEQDLKSLEDKEEKKIKNKEDEELITFQIKKGEPSEKIIQNLYDLGIIEDKKEFEKIVIEKEAEKRFIYGIYKLQKNMDYEELLNTLCGF